MSRRIPFAALALAMFAATAAQAGTIYSDNLSGLGEVASPGSLSTSFSAGSAGSGTLSFKLAGFASLDGDGNCCTDVFRLSVNGVEVFNGSFNLGGGGSNLVYLAPAGSSVLVTTNGASDDPHDSHQLTWAGGTAEISLPVALLAGTNTLSFSYTGGAQGLGDEGWGINAVTVTSAVPEPQTVALMLAGLGLVGFAGRRRKPE